MFKWQKNYWYFNQLILIVCLVIPFASADYSDALYSINTLDLSSSLKIIEQKQDYDIEYINTDILFFPESDNSMEIQSFTTEPGTSKVDGKIRFTWTGKRRGSLNYRVNAKVKTFSQTMPVKSTIQFPLNNNFDSDVKQFLKGTDNIEIDDKDIQDIANELAKGETDLFKVVSKLAFWVEDNIQYNLSTVTVDAAQSASWVIKNRYGVCDEISNLFIALNRAVGIPARFIAGVSYTDSLLFSEKWGPHGWVEVYFPGVGWVPFDITYQQYGWVDSSHIKLHEAMDALEPSTQFEWRGRNVDLQVQPLNIKVDTQEIGPSIKENLVLKSSLLSKDVGFGSYNLIIVKVQNPSKKYVSASFDLAQTQAITQLDSARKHVTLSPGGKQNIYWLIRVDDNLDYSLKYELPLMILGPRSLHSNLTLTATNNGKVIDKSTATNHMPTEFEPAIKGDWTAECNSELIRFYPYESNSIICTVKNFGNSKISAKVCLQDSCLENFVSISGDRSFVLEPNINSFGPVLLSPYVEVNGEKKVFVLTIDRLDVPKIKISNLSYPNFVSYDDNFEIEMVINKESKSSPKNITTTIKLSESQSSWDLDYLANSHRFILNAKGANLKDSKNALVVTVDYYDENGLHYTQGVVKTIERNRLTILQMIRAFILTVQNSFMSLFK